MNPPDTRITLRLAVLAAAVLASCDEPARGAVEANEAATGAPERPFTAELEANATASETALPAELEANQAAPAGSETPLPAELETNEAKASYALGRGVGAQLTDFRGGLEYESFVRGLRDAMDGAEMPVPQGDLDAAVSAVLADLAAEREEARGPRMAADAAFREAFAAEEGTIATASGLLYKVLEEGSGDSPTGDDRVRLHYRGTLVDGTEFESSLGGPPAEFAIDGLIEGFGEALRLMREGSRFRVVIPPELAYGEAGRGGVVLPGATLVVEMHLVEIVED